MLADIGYIVVTQIVYLIGEKYISIKYLHIYSRDLLDYAPIEEMVKALEQTSLTSDVKKEKDQSDSK